MSSAPLGFTSSTKVRSGFDPQQAREQLLALQEFYTTFGAEAFCRTFLMILVKKNVHGRAPTRLLPFELHAIQQDLQNTAGLRNIVVKPRQIGSTTWHMLCRLLIPAILEPGSAGLLISQTKPYGAQHFRILQRALKNFGRTPLWAGAMGGDVAMQMAEAFAKNLLHTQYSARHELLFDFLDSKVLVDTAENEDAGTGLTVNHMVATEVAYWKRNPEILLMQAKEAIPSNGTIDLESTPNGMGGYFFEEWMRAKDGTGEFRAHFYPWWMQREYQLSPPAEEETITDEERKMAEQFKWTMRQLAWRRKKTISLRERFPEKYPENATECWLTSGDTFFSKEILRWLKTELAGKKPQDSYQDGSLLIYRRRIKGRRYVIGADPAEGSLVSTRNPDYNAAVIFDVETGELMADYRSRVPQEQFAMDLVTMAEMYNSGMIAVERNIGQFVINQVQRQLLYGNIYMHKDWWKEQKQIIPVPGFPMNIRFRPLALNRLKEMIQEAGELFHSERFVDEALTFVWTATKKEQIGGARKPQAIPGAHDDLVMAGAVAAAVRSVLLGHLDPIISPSEAYGEIYDEDADAA